MGKVVKWDQTKSPMGKIATQTYREKCQKSFELLAEQKKAEEYMKEAYPIMKSLLMTRILERTPLKVMRPLQYTSEEMQTLYKCVDPETREIRQEYLSKSQLDPRLEYEAVGASNFVSVAKMVQPGEEIVFHQFDKQLNQLIFKSNSGEEIGIYLEEQDRLLTQTDVYEVVSKYLDNKEN